MLGLFGLGVGVAFGWSVFRGAAVSSPLAAWALLAVSYWLVWRWGRRGRVSATATAVAVATATADAAATSSSAVNVFIAQAPVDARLDRLQTVAWRDEQTVSRGVTDRDFAGQIEASDLGESVDFDDLDPVDARERIRRGELSERS